eukprot:4383216-Amphidinium_carterae.1
MHQGLRGNEKITVYKYAGHDCEQKKNWVASLCGGNCTTSTRCMQPLKLSLPSPLTCTSRFDLTQSLEGLATQKLHT